MSTNDECLLINSRLFTVDQVKRIKEMRSQYEGKIQMKDKQALFAYIEFEKKILKKIQTHIKKCDDLTKDSVLRVIRIHNIALSMFKDELKFWISYIKFCTEIGKSDLVSKSIPMLLDVHKKEEKVWHLAAKWELNKCNNIEKALNYLYKGLHYNPKASSLYIYILRLVFLKLNDSNKDKIEEQEKIETEAIDLFQKATKVELGLSVFIEILKLVTEYDYTKKLQYLICDYLVQNYANKDEIWHLLAQRELDGHHITENDYKFIKDKNERIKNCLKLYEKAIKIIPTENMWAKYLDVLVDLYETNTTNILIKENFISACDEAHKKCYMTEKHYISWLKCLNDSEQVPEILEFATKHKPNCVQLWDVRINYHSKKGPEFIDKIFEEAINILGDKSLPIWRRKIQYYQLTGHPNNKIESIFREGLKFSPVINSALQSQFLEWTALFRTTDVAHDLYKDLSSKESFSLDIHIKMAELEAISSNPNEEIFNSIKSNIKRYPDALAEWDEYVKKEIYYGPSWRGEIYKKYLLENSSTFLENELLLT